MKNCPVCNKEFLSKREFCSRECFDLSRHITKKCLTCSKDFNVLKCHEQRKFCSRKCIQILKPKKLIKMFCAWCSKDYMRYESAIKGQQHSFCNRDCYDEFHSQLTITTNCEYCGNTFNCSSINKRKYCSRECYKKDYTPTNYAKGSIKGWYQSNKAGLIKYDSSLELNRIKSLDFDYSVVSFSRCKDKILWIDDEGKKHYYTPDFDITYVNDIRVVEETKGFVNSDVQKKIKAAELFYNDICLYRIIYQDEIKEKLEYFVRYYTNSLGVKSRPRIEYSFMKTSISFSELSTCNRLKVGAIFVDPITEQVLGLGYNGTWAHGPNDCDSLEPGKCGCVHAEVNAIANANVSLSGSTLYVTTAPCFSCSKLLINKKIAKVIYHKAYRDVSGITLLRRNNIEVTKYDDLVDFCVNDSEQVGDCTTYSDLPG